MKIAGTKCAKKRRFVDVGSNFGIYSLYFATKFSKIEAFEPISEISQQLKRLQTPNFRLHEVALSSQNGQKNINTPIIDGAQNAALASLESRGGPCKTRVVPTRTLDSFHFQDVDLIKIDVEGHELDVIKGARRTILTSKPVMIVEIEDRHASAEVKNVLDTITSMGYVGYFLLGKHLVSISEFSVDEHQTPYLHRTQSPEYVNNFIFFPA